MLFAVWPIPRQAATISNAAAAGNRPHRHVQHGVGSDLRLTSRTSRGIAMNRHAQRVCHTIVALGCAAAFLAAPTIDAQSTRWVATGPLNVPRYAHTATLLADGSVLVVGGFNGLNSG